MWAYRQVFNLFQPHDLSSSDDVAVVIFVYYLIFFKFIIL